MIIQHNEYAVHQKSYLNTFSLSDNQPIIMQTIHEHMLHVKFQTPNHSSNSSEYKKPLGFFAMITEQNKDETRKQTSYAHMSVNSNSGSDVLQNICEHITGEWFT